MHGGGFVLGSLESADPIARELCAGAGVLVASVDYPLAPEHPVSVHLRPYRSRNLAHEALDGVRLRPRAGPALSAATAPVATSPR